VRLLYSFPHAVGSPGIGTTALQQIRALIGRGVEVTVYCASTRVDLAGAARVVQTMAVAGRRVPHRAIGVDRAYRYHDRRVALALRHGRGRPDVVHAWPLGALETFRAAAAAGIPTAREVPNTHTAEAYARAEREAAALGMPPVAGQSHSFDARRLAREEAEYAAATTLLAPSPHVAGTFTDRGVDPARLSLVRYGFDPASFPAPGAIAHADAGRGLRLVFVGRCEPRKGLHHALRAWAASGAGERGRLRIHGDFAPGYREAIAPLLEAPGVEVAGFTDDVAAALRAADALILPSAEEGSALVTYEAQASGCALLVSEEAGALAVHGESALIHRAGDVATLTEHLRMLDADRQLLDRLRRTAAGRRALLSWSSAGRRLIEVYAGLSAAAEG
jgi:glycosyltransferase involved in cell wall biosynthesis